MPSLNNLRLALALAACTLLPALALAQANNRFDLTGPKIDVHIQRGDKSLPVAMVPNLQAGDKLTVHADLPPTQSVKLMLVVAFLRGSTNPPPENWFTRVNTWDKKVRSEGITVTVPEEAQQALIFLAPETGGDFNTLKSAVTGRPGVFVRAAQDLNEASFEQARIERYLQALKRVPPDAPSKDVLDHSHKLAATLNLKPNDDCFKKPADQQVACLSQTGTQILLDDGHGQTLAAMISSGDSANLIGAAAGTPMANTGGAAAYSAYVGTVIDLVHLMAGLHTAQFQYIPAIAFPDEETLNLRLNTPPSFHNPKSVIVVALPAIQKAVAPPLRLQDPGHVSCLLQPSMVLPLEGAPLVFATGFAHDLVLHLNNGATLDGKTDLPLVPDAYEGGLVLSTDHPDRKPLPVAAPEARDSADNPTGAPAAIANRSEAPQPPPKPGPAATDSTTGDVEITGTLRGQWGFDAFTGITVPLQRRTGSGWSAAAGNELIAGKANQLTLHATGTACASAIALDGPGAHDLKLDFKQVATPGGTPRLEVKLPLEKAAPGKLALLVHQFGTDRVEDVPVTAYSDATRLHALHIHAGDNYATLTGTGLGSVATVKLAGSEYLPAPDQAADSKELRLVAPDPTRDNSKEKDGKDKGPLSTAGQSGTAEAVLRDGRSMPVPYTVDAARPSVTVLNRTARAEQQTGLPLNLAGKDDLPLNARITFALRSDFPARFPRGEKVEIALADGSLHSTLSLADGSVVLQDSRTALAYFSPGKTFGPSAFGPLQLRVIGDDGTPGDWLPAGTLVRTPTITAITCPKAPKTTPNTPATPPAPATSGPAAQPTATATTPAAAPAQPTTTADVPATPPAAAQPPATQPPATQLTAPSTPDATCQLTGKDLFLIDATAADATFTTPSEVPLGFAGEAIPVPRPTDNHTLYLKLRDDPTAVIAIPLPTPPTTSTHPGRA